ncbi:MAG: alpha/beta fold hydrolase [Pseudomonadota bacterium]
MSKRATARIGDGEMAMLRFGVEGAPPLLFAHANGFCASAYRQMLEALGSRFDVFAVDLRGHGRTRLPPPAQRHQGLDLFGADVAALLDSLSLRIDKGARWTLSGHSLGGVAVTFAAVNRRDVAALRLIEPVATPPFWSGLARSPVWPLVAPRIPLVKGALARRGRWPDRETVRASYAGKPLFSTWASGVLDDYLADGLKAEDGGVALSCAPEWEAANFAAQAHDFWAAFAAAPAPVAVLAARHPSSTVSPYAVRRFAALGAEVVEVGGRTHLIPFEDPPAAARFLAGA